MSSSVRALAQELAASNRTSIYKEGQASVVDNNINIALAKYVVLFLNGEIDNLANYKNFFTIFLREVKANLNKDKSSSTNLISMFDNYSIKYTFGGNIEIAKNMPTTNNSDEDFKTIDMSNKDEINCSEAKQLFPKLTENRWNEITNLFGYCQNNIDIVKENYYLRKREENIKRMNKQLEIKEMFKQELNSEINTLKDKISNGGNYNIDMSYVNLLKGCIETGEYDTSLLRSSAVSNSSTSSNNNGNSTPSNLKSVSTNGKSSK